MADEGASKGITFLQFLFGMYSQSLMQLGLMSNPITNKTEFNLEQAKQSIDLMGILEEKTKGNLNEDEDKNLKAMLSHLRIAYVQSATRTAPPAVDGAEKPDGQQGQG